MLKNALLIFLVLFSASRSAASSPVMESWSGHWKGARYRVEASSPSHLGAVAWNPESGDVPLKLNDALQAARTAMRRMVGEGQAHFRCDEIRLRDFGGTGKWAYIVQFISDHPSQTATGRSDDHASLPFVVYLDGFVQTPETNSVSGDASAAAQENPRSQSSPSPQPTAGPAAAIASWGWLEGLLPKDIPRFVRPYEPTQLGYTKDDGDKPFMDFTFSAMFPILGKYPVEEGRAGPPQYSGRSFDFREWSLFFSGTIRAGQYINTRPSSPVVGKRFNPQLFVRFWGLAEGDASPTSADNYLDFIFFGHESNGQSIGDRAAFDTQREIYRRIEDDPSGPVADRRSHKSARDAISRGWDYVGLEWAWARNHQNTDMDRSRKLGTTVRLKLRYFLPVGIAQGHAEQYESWEGFPVGQPRRYYDGITLRVSNKAEFLRKATPFFTGRQTLTYTTGYSKIGRHSTFEYEIGMKIGALPISIWTRHGYTSDLTDYYTKDSSSGFRISIWEY